MCSDPRHTFNNYENVKPCPVCGEDTIDGLALDSCYWSEVECEECQSAPCNESC